MKKNTRIISMAAAALLAVSPVVASTMTANADTAVNIGATSSTGTNTSTNAPQAPTDKPYFTFNNEVIGEATQANPTGNVVRTTISIKSSDKVSDVMKQITNSVEFHQNNNSSEKITFTESDFINELKKYGVEVGPEKKGSNVQVITKVPSTSFNFTISKTVNNQTATIQIPVVPSVASTTPDTTANPVFKWNLGNQPQSDSLNGHVFQVAVNTNFSPTNFVNSNGEQVSIWAQQTKDNSTYASVSASSSVNTSEAGRYYNVTLTATGMTGKKTTVTYTVLITSSQKQTLYANGASSIATYNIYGNNVLSGSTTFKDGEQVYVADQTKTINGVSYSQVSTKSKNDASTSGIWVKTSSLVKPAGDTNVKTLPVMVDSRAYSKTGQYLGHMYYAYNNIDIVPTVVNINGKTYYKVANKDEYVRVTNITGNKRTLKHNAYIYWSSYRRTPGTGKMYRGQTVTTYGGQMKFKNGKKYYRIEGCRDNNKRYIKAVNFY